MAGLYVLKSRIVMINLSSTMCLSVIFVLQLVIITFVKSGPLSERIVNGIDAPITPFHAHVRIRESAESITAFVGSGAIISPRHVLTVGQNVNNFGHWEIGVGNTTFIFLQYYPASSAILHPNFDSVTLNFNIAVIILDIALQIIPNMVDVIPIQQSNGWPIAGQFTSVTGFGFTTNIGHFAEHLQLINLRVFDDNSCQQQFPELTLNGHFCAFDLDTIPPNPPGNICAGDQGGPCFFPFIPYALVGLTSYTTMDCTAGLSAVFVRVSSHSEWIQEILATPLE